MIYKRLLISLTLLHISGCATFSYEDGYSFKDDSGWEIYESNQLHQATSKCDKPLTIHQVTNKGVLLAVGPLIPIIPMYVSNNKYTDNPMISVSISTTFSDSVNYLRNNVTLLTTDNKTHKPVKAEDITLDYESLNTTALHFDLLRDNIDEFRLVFSSLHADCVANEIKLVKEKGLNYRYWSGPY